MDRKPVIAIALSLSLLLPAGMASASGKNRVVSAPYDAAAGISTEDGWAGWSLPVVTSGAMFEAKPGERRATIEVKDHFGDIVLAHVHVDRDGDGIAEVDKDICGKSEGSFSVTGDSAISVWPLIGECGDGISVPFFGEIEVTFRK